MTRDAADTMLAAALEYAARGVPVFPVWGIREDGQCACGASLCDNPGKHPVGYLVPQAFKTATTDGAVIRAWWTQEPHANIAAATGVFSTVLDVDPRHEGDETLRALERRHGPLPETPEVLTGGRGRHLHFAPEPDVPSSTGRIGPGLDMKSAGGYVLLPPSRHVSGRAYCDEVEHPLFETPLAPMPVWLRALAMGSRDGQHSPAAPVEDVIAKGRRNATITSLAGSMRRRGMTETAICAALLVTNQERCRPPLGEGEVREIAASVARYAPASEPGGEDEVAMDDTPGPKVLIGPAIATAVVTEPDWIIAELFSHQHQHLIVGESEGAKTWTLFDLALAVADPSIATFLGQPVRRHGRVCIESWEQGQAEDLRRLHKLARGHGLTSFDPVILVSETLGTLADEAYFTTRFRALREWGVLLYAVDSLSEAAGIELNDNTAYTAWWRCRIRPLLKAGIMVVATHLTGHIKPGIGRTREAVVRNATQIRALTTQVIECRRQGETTFKLLHNKHRNSTGLPLGLLDLAGAMSDPWVRLDVRAEAPRVPPATKEALARDRLLDLGRAHPEAWLTRKDIEQALNGPDVPDAKRISGRSWEPALAALTADKVFEKAKRGNADVWRWLKPPEDAAGSPDEPEDDDVSTF